MAAFGQCCLLLAYLCTGCGARTGIDTAELTTGGRPGSGMPSAGAAGSGKAGSNGGVPPTPGPRTEPLRAQSVAVGGRHSCAVLATGLKCWGANLYGVLGLEDQESRGDAPNEMGDRLPFIALGPGARIEGVVPGGDVHTCALLNGGLVKCWGDNDFGQLGLETFIDRGGYPGEMGEALPFVALGNAAVVRRLALGSNHSCALLDDASLKCWGNNSNGQLGLGPALLKGGSTGDMGEGLPRVNLAGARVVAVAAASVHTCALLEDGSVKCWGWERGFEDQPTTPDSPLTTVDLRGLRAVDLAAGGAHTCAVLSDQSVCCWTVTEHVSLAPLLSLPVNFGTAATPRQLSVGGGRGCALLSDASVRCWALGEAGTPALASPIQFEPGRRVVQVSASGGRQRHHGCALLDNGSVQCWGENADGQLGVGDVTPRDGSQPGSLLAVDLGSSG